jgi:cell division protein FtsL
MTEFKTIEVDVVNMFKGPITQPLSASFIISGKLPKSPIDIKLEELESRISSLETMINDLEKEIK